MLSLTALFVHLLYIYKFYRYSSLFLFYVLLYLLEAKRSLRHMSS